MTHVPVDVAVATAWVVVVVIAVMYAYDQTAINGSVSFACSLGNGKCTMPILSRELLDPVHLCASVTVKTRFMLR